MATTKSASTIAAKQSRQAKRQATITLDVDTPEITLAAATPLHESVIPTSLEVDPTLRVCNECGNVLPLDHRFDTCQVCFDKWSATLPRCKKCGTNAAHFDKRYQKQYDTCRHCYEKPRDNQTATQATTKRCKCGVIIQPDAGECFQCRSKNGAKTRLKAAKVTVIDYGKMNLKDDEIVPTLSALLDEAEETFLDGDWVGCNRKLDQFFEQKGIFTLSHQISLIDYGDLSETGNLLYEEIIDAIETRNTHLGFGKLTELKALIEEEQAELERIHDQEMIRIQQAQVEAQRQLREQERARQEDLRQRERARLRQINRQELDEIYADI
jgi:hypothetical protein